MFNDIKKLAKHSVIYGMGSLLSKLLSFALLPIYTRHLTPANYGIISLLIVTNSIAGIIVKLGLGSAIFREILYRGSDESEVESTSIYFLLFISSTIYGILIIYSSKLSLLIFGQKEYSKLLQIIFVIGIFQVINLVVMARMRIHKWSARYASLSLARFLISAILNIYFVAILKWGINGLLIAWLIAEALFLIVNIVLLMPVLKLKFSFSILRRMLCFGVPLVPFGLARIIMTAADRYFLKYYSTTEQVGLYSIGYNIGMAINLIVNAIQLAWPAQMYAMVKKPGAEKMLSRMLTYYFVTISFIGLSLSVLSREILLIMTTPMYYNAYKVVPLISSSYILYGIMYMTNVSLETRNKTKYMSPIIIIAAVFNILLNILLIPNWGIMGAALATLMSYAVLVILNLIMNLKIWYIKYEYIRLLKIIMICSIIYSISTFIKLENGWISFGIKIALILLYPLLLYIIGFYKENEIKKIMWLTSKLFQKIMIWRS